MPESGNSESLRETWLLVRTRRANLGDARKPAAGHCLELETRRLGGDSDPFSGNLDVVRTSGRRRLDSLCFLGAPTLGMPRKPAAGHCLETLRLGVSAVILIRSQSRGVKAWRLTRIAGGIRRTRGAGRRGRFRVPRCDRDRRVRALKPARSQCPQPPRAPTRRGPRAGGCSAAL